jgi:hypothetical protein
LGIAVSCILSMWPSHRIRWLLINLTILSPLIMSSNSSFRRILHNSLRGFNWLVKFFFFFYGATARSGPWPPLQYVSKPLDPLLYLSIRLVSSWVK